MDIFLHNHSTIVTPKKINNNLEHFAIAQFHLLKGYEFIFYW